MRQVARKIPLKSTGTPTKLVEGDSSLKSTGGTPSSNLLPPPVAWDPRLQESPLLLVICLGSGHFSDMVYCWNLIGTPLADVPSPSPNPVLVAGLLSPGAWDEPAKSRLHRSPSLERDHQP
jgi:hypothetical protein